MFDNFSDGYCPECLLKDAHVEMLLNRRDYWECPTCRLQAAGGGPGFMVLRERGKGQYKSYRVAASEHVTGALITRQSADDPFESDGAFQDEAEFREFLEKEVGDAGDR